MWAKALVVVILPLGPSSSWVPPSASGAKREWGGGGVRGKRGEEWKGHLSRSYQCLGFSHRLEPENPDTVRAEHAVSCERNTGQFLWGQMTLFYIRCRQGCGIIGITSLGPLKVIQIKSNQINQIRIYLLECTSPLCMWALSMHLSSKTHI